MNLYKASFCLQSSSSIKSLESVTTLNSPIQTLLCICTLFFCFANTVDKIYQSKYGLNHFVVALSVDKPKSDQIK